MRVSLLLLALSVAGVAWAGGPGDDPAAVLVETDLAFGRATAERGREGWLAYFAEEAAIFPTTSPIVRGLEAIRAYYDKTGFDPRGLTWKPVHAEMAASGDLGYTFGTWRFTGTTPDGKTVTRTGKYTTIWRKQGDGSWKLVVDIGAADTNPE